jgi:hypothetical protein
MEEMETRKMIDFVVEKMGVARSLHSLDWMRLKLPLQSSTRLPKVRISA